jgi:hypothetical protein
VDVKDRQYLLDVIKRNDISIRSFKQYFFQEPSYSHIDTATTLIEGEKIKHLKESKSLDAYNRLIGKKPIRSGI